MRYINHLSDFQVIINIKDKDGNIIAPPSVPWEAVFADENCVEFKCFFDGTNYTHCIVDGNDIVCFVDNPGFSCGNLRCTFCQHVPSAEYCDGVMDLTQPLQCDIMLSKRESDDSTPITIEASPNWVRGPQGEQGIQGPQGIKGEKGDKGDKGDTGDKGDKGERGEKGDTGAKGEKGDRGEKGDQGERGLQGVQGVKGDDGVSPTVTTSKTGKVTTIEITDANGVHTATVNDGESVEVVQSTGNSTTSVMSQKASTDSFIANTPSGDPMHNLYVEVGAIYNNTGKDIERVDQWGDTIIHKDGCWYLNGLGDLTNYDLLKCWIWGNCLITNYNFTYSSRRSFMDTKTNIHQNIKDDYPYRLSDAYKSLQIVNKLFTTFSFNEHDANTANNDVKNLDSYTMYSTGIIKYYGWIVVGSIDKYTFSAQDKTEAIGLVLTKNSYINLPKLRADCIRQIIEAVRATDNITITLHPEAYDRAIADTGVQTALTNKTNVSLAKAE